MRAVVISQGFDRYSGSIGFGIAEGLKKAGWATEWETVREGWPLSFGAAPPDMVLVVDLPSHPALSPDRAVGQRILYSTSPEHLDIAALTDAGVVLWTPEPWVARQHPVGVLTVPLAFPDVLLQEPKEPYRIDTNEIMFPHGLSHAQMLLVDSLEERGLRFVSYAVPQNSSKIDDFLAAYAFYRRASVLLNLQTNGDIESEPTTALNKHAWEMAAAGVFQIIEARPQATEMLPDAVVCRFDLSDILSKIRYFSSRAEERRRIAARVQDRVRPHSWSNRVLSALRTMNLAE